MNRARFVPTYLRGNTGSFLLRICTEGLTPDRDRYNASTTRLTLFESEW